MRHLLISLLIVSLCTSPIRADDKLEKKLAAQTETIKQQQVEIDQLKKLIAGLTTRI